MSLNYLPFIHERASGLMMPLVLCGMLLMSCSGVIDFSDTRDDSTGKASVTASFRSDSTKASTTAPDSAMVRIILSVLGWGADRPAAPEYIYAPALEVVCSDAVPAVGRPCELSVICDGKTYAPVVSSSDRSLSLDGARVTAYDCGPHVVTVAAEINGKWMWRKYAMNVYYIVPIYMYIKAKTSGNNTYGNSEVVMQNFGDDPVTVSIGVKANAKPLIGKTKSEWLYPTKTITLLSDEPFPLSDYLSLSSWVKQHLTSSFSLEVFLTCQDSYTSIDFNADNIRDNIVNATNRNVAFYYNGTKLW